MSDNPATEVDAALDPRIRVGYFRHPGFPGDEIDPECGMRWHDHGWIDQYHLSQVMVGHTPEHGLTICPRPPLPPGLEAAIEAGVADGSIFSENHRKD